MKLHTIVLVPSVVGASFLACNGSPNGPAHRVVGIIDAAGTSYDALVVPDTVHLGVAFTVTVATFGSSCLRPDGAEVQVSSLTANITPYDLEPGSGIVCTGDFRPHPRTVAIMFSQPGAALVRLHGRGYQTPTLIIAEPVVVQP